MILWQRDMFDTSLDVIIIGTPNEVAKPRKPRKNKQESIPGGLLPWLFPEEYPEHQEAIEQTHFTWRNQDISTLCEAVLRDAIYSLLTPKCGTSLRNDATEWLLNLQVEPFSFVHCCMEMNVNPERMRQGIAQQILQRRVFLRKQTLLSPKEFELLEWMDQAGWINELTSMNFQDGGRFNPTEIIAHYERQSRQSTCRGV